MSNKNVGCSVSVGGLSIGGVLGGLISFYINKSIGYAILHFLCSWFYVLYALMAHSDKLFATIKGKTIWH